MDLDGRFLCLWMGEFTSGFLFGLSQPLDRTIFDSLFDVEPVGLLFVFVFVFETSTTSNHHGIVGSSSSLVGQGDMDHLHQRGRSWIWRRPGILGGRIFPHPLRLDRLF